MLPDNLPNSYGQYKKDTSVFATWLCNVAEECGYLLPSSASSSSDVKPVATTKLDVPVAANAPSNVQGKKAKGKGKAKKSTKATPPPPPPPPASTEQTTYKIPTREILVQANTIASSKKPKIVVPLSIQGVLRRAIVTRSLFSSWFANKKVTSEEKELWRKKNESHAFFIRVLEDCSSILEGCFEKRAVRTVRNGREKGNVDDNEDAGMNRGGNRFGGLDVEDCEDDEDLDITVEDLDIDDSIPRRAKGKGGKREKKECEFDIEEEDELSISVFCLFEDLQAIRESLQETWRLAKDDQSPIDWKTAALITNLALDSVRSAEIEMVASNPKFLGVYHGGSYFEMLDIIASTVPKEIQDAHAELPRGSFLMPNKFPGEAVYQSITVTMCKYFTPAANDNKFRPWRRVMSAGEFSVQYPGIEPKSPKWPKEDEILSQMMMDLNWNLWCDDTIKDDLDRDAWPYEDVITEGLQKFMETASLALWQVFAARLALDIREIMHGEEMCVYREVRQRAARAMEILGIEVSVDRKDDAIARFGMTPLPDSPFYSLEYNERTLLPNQMAAVALWIQYNILDNNMINYKNCTMAQAPRLWPPQRGPSEKPDDELWFDQANGFADFAVDFGEAFSRIPNLNIGDQPRKLPAVYQPPSVEDEPDEEDIPSNEYSAETAHKYTIPSSDPAFYHRNSPVYCAMQFLKFSTILEKLGVHLCNSQASLLPAAHLYNAGHQVKLLGEEQKWENLERAMEAHMDRFFKGGVLPTDAGTIVRRYMLTMGFPLRTFASSTRRMASKFELKKILTKKEHIIPMKTSPLIKSYIDGLISANDLIRALSAEQVQSEGRPRKTNITRLETLMQARDWLPKPLKLMEIDWITLTKSTTRVMWELRSRLHSKLGMDLKPPEEFDDFWKRPQGCESIVRQIFENAFGQEMKAELASGRRNMKDPKGEFLRIDEGSALSIAVGVVKEHLKSATELNVQPFKTLPGV